MSTFADLRTLLEQTARREPRAPAVVSPGRPALSWSGLAEQVAAVGGALAGHGIGSGERVATWFDCGALAADFLVQSARLDRGQHDPLVLAGGRQDLLAGRNLRRIIGLDLDQYRKIKRVIGVAGGEEKIAAIRAAIKGELINVLVTDDRTAARLLAED